MEKEPIKEKQLTIQFDEYKDKRLTIPFKEELKEVLEKWEDKNEIKSNYVILNWYSNLTFIY